MACLNPKAGRVLRGHNREIRIPKIIIVVNSLDQEIIPEEILLVVMGSDMKLRGRC